MVIAVITHNDFIYPIVDTFLWVEVESCDFLVQQLMVNDKSHSYPYAYNHDDHDSRALILKVPFITMIYEGYYSISRGLDDLSGSRIFDVVNFG